jgi:hypothetical protein
MAKINFQFHGVLSEIELLSVECAKKYGLYVVLICFFPEFKARLLDVESGFGCFSDVDRVCFSNVRPNIFAVSALDFMAKNPNCLSLTVGKYDKSSLKESILSVNTEDSDSLDFSRKMIKKLKTITFEGAWVASPDGTSRKYLKKHRYTDGAKKLAEKGVKLAPVAGWNSYILEGSP